MVTIDYSPDFQKIIQKLDSRFKLIIKSQITKIIKNPEIGKPMRCKPEFS